MSDHVHNHADKGAAVAGFFAGAIAILVIATTIVFVTNNRLAGKEGGEKPAAEATK